MDIYNLKPGLGDPVIDFANTKLIHPDQVKEVFSGIWKPESLPRLRGCREVQSEVRGWLADIEGSTASIMWAFCPEVELTVTPGFHIQKIYDDDGVSDGTTKNRITWNWRVTKSSLRAICGFGIACIIEDGLKDKVGLCDRPECNNIFIDRNSRGNRRKFCKTDDCNAVRNRKYVKDSKK